MNEDQKQGDAENATEQLSLEEQLSAEKATNEQWAALYNVALSAANDVRQTRDSAERRTARVWRIGYAAVALSSIVGVLSVLLANDRATGEGVLWSRTVKAEQLAAQSRDAERKTAGLLGECQAELHISRMSLEPRPETFDEKMYRRNYWCEMDMRTMEAYGAEEYFEGRMCRVGDAEGEDW